MNKQTQSSAATLNLREDTLSMEQFGTIDKILAWSVHLLTSSGMVVGLLAIISVANGHWRAAMAYMLLNVVIDGIDGTLARKFRVKEVLPFFDGKTIDYVIDFATHAIVPAYFLYASGLVPPDWSLFTASLMLLISCFYYGKTGMVSDDMHFIGFPVMWNFVVFYLFFVLTLGAWWNFAIIIIFSILHFIPVKYPYPSRTKEFKKLNISFVVICFVSTVLVVWFYPESNIWLNTLSLSVVVYFALMAAYKTFFFTPKA